MFLLVFFFSLGDSRPFHGICFVLNNIIILLCVYVATRVSLCVKCRQLHANIRVSSPPVCCLRKCTTICIDYCMYCYVHEVRNPEEKIQDTDNGIYTNCIKMSSSFYKHVHAQEAKIQQPIDINKSFIHFIYQFVIQGILRPKHRKIVLPLCPFYSQLTVCSVQNIRQHKIETCVCFCYRTLKSLLN